jgi:aminomuconate-semialdehyde/2-hydroxymuconate-6-semialdehyde dehydrogenase
MMETTIKSSFANQGEICLCGSRIFIEEPIYEKFKLEFVKRTQKLKVGDPSNNKNNLGAIVSRQHKEKILSYIELAKKEGGKILCGGDEAIISGKFSEGWFVNPTIIEGLPFDCRTNQEEIFGPVVTLIPFQSEKEVLQMANSTPFGLSCTVWTENLTQAHQLAAKLQMGIIWLNCWLVRDLRTPFGGMKTSGVGREGGVEALRFFTEPKNVCVKL